MNRRFSSTKADTNRSSAVGGEKGPGWPASGEGEPRGCRPSGCKTGQGVSPIQSGLSVVSSGGGSVRTG